MTQMRHYITLLLFSKFLEYILYNKYNNSYIKYFNKKQLITNDKQRLQISKKLEIKRNISKNETLIVPICVQGIQIYKKYKRMCQLNIVHNNQPGPE